jgi:hypothetical protein
LFTKSVFVGLHFGNYLDSAEVLPPGAPFHSLASIPIYSTDISASGTT